MYLNSYITFYIHFTYRAFLCILQKQRGLQLSMLKGPLTSAGLNNTVIPTTRAEMKKNRMLYKDTWGI